MEVEVTYGCFRACKLTLAARAVCGIAHDDRRRRSAGSIRVDMSIPNAPITEVIVGFIGGEQLLQKRKVLCAIEDMSALADRLDVRLNTQIDTNGLLLDSSVVAPTPRIQRSRRLPPGVGATPATTRLVGLMHLMYEDHSWCYMSNTASA